MKILSRVEKFSDELKLALFSKIFEMLPILDETLESSLESHIAIEETIKKSLAIVRRFSGSGFAWLWTFNEKLIPCLFYEADEGINSDTQEIFTKFENLKEVTQIEESMPGYYIPIKVNQKFLGYFGLIPGKSKVQGKTVTPDEERILLECICETFLEFFDNFLYSFYESRVKHLAEKSLSSAISHKNFTTAILKASEVLQEHVDFQELVIFFHDEDDIEVRELNYFILRNTGEIYDPYKHFDKQIHTFMLSQGKKLLRNEENTVYEFLTSKKWHEEFLISGIVHAKTVGAVIIGSLTSEFSRFEKDLLEIFVSFIRQRVLDYNKEWFLLAKFFSISNRTKLLDRPGYKEQFLQPITREMVILYADISGFTYLCDQALQSAESVVQLVETWSKKAIAILWENSGTLDKLVGDCVIGLFGPPFFNITQEQASVNAINAAREINKMTNEILTDKGKCFEEITAKFQDISLGCSIGIGVGPVCVGIVGLNSDYTCFGKSMNNTARVQGAAKKNQILVFEEVKKLIEKKFNFGPKILLELKNVKDKFAVHELLDQK
ncbi:adenylate/guanylate cyclase domain-containing protein [Candidatus Riflebacteria bacterium]